MNIRKATNKDCAGLAQVQVDSYQTAYAPLFPPGFWDHITYEEQEQDWQEWLIEHPDDLLCVAEMDGGEIAGYALARAGLSEVTPYDSELIALHVRPSWYRHGVGRQLTSFLAQQLHAQGCQSLILWVLQENHNARAFYERLGGQLLSEQKESGSGAIEVAYGWLDLKHL